MPPGTAIHVTNRGLSLEQAAVLTGLAAIWGASFLFMKVALDDLSPLAVAAGRLVLGAISIVGWLLATRGRRATRALVRGVTRRDTLVLAVTGSSVPFILIAWAETRMASSLAGILNGGLPLVTAVMAVRLDPASRLRGVRNLGLLVGFAGVALVAGGELDGGPLGVAAMLGAIVLYGFSALHARRRFAAVPPVAVALIQAVLGSAITAPLALAFGRPDHMPAGNTFAAMLALGVGGTGLAYVMYYWLVARAGAQHAVAVTYLVPIAAVVYGRVFLGERLSAVALFGAAVILVGQAVTSLPGRRATEQVGQHAG